MIQPPETNFKLHTFCGWCGTRFTDQKSFPRKCFHCYNDTYLDPKVIVVAIIPVFDRDDPFSGKSFPTSSQCGWLIQQRNIEPKKGGWAFPGGYIEYGESWQHAAAREVKEEVGLITKPEDYHLVEVLNATNNNVLIFGAHSNGVYRDEVNFQPNHEASAIAFPILPEHQELCFPTHNEVWSRYYNSSDY